MEAVLYLKCFPQTLFCLIVLLHLGCQLPEAEVTPPGSECTLENPCESELPACGDGQVDDPWQSNSERAHANPRPLPKLGPCPDALH